MLGNLMDVNKLSLWKNGGGGGGVLVARGKVLLLSYVRERPHTERRLD